MEEERLYNYGKQRVRFFGKCRRSDGSLHYAPSRHFTPQRYRSSEDGCFRV